MILVDTSIWIDHLRAGNATLVGLLQAAQVLVHPFVLGEIALGQLRQRSVVLSLLSNLPEAVVATDAEVLRFVERYALYGKGIGWVDTHLLASLRLTVGARLWTGDKRLLGVAAELRIAALLPEADRP